MNRRERSISDFGPSFENVPVLLLFWLLVITLAPPPIRATAISTGSIQVSDFMMTSSGGTLVFLGPWTAQAFVQVQNSLGENQAQFNSSTGGIAQASAAVQFASAQSTSNAQNVVQSASGGVNILGGVNAALSDSQATLYNMFEITGPGGPVNVTSSVTLAYMQRMFTDASGVFANNEVAFTLSVDGMVVLFNQSTNQIGSNYGLWTNNFSSTLTNTIALNENQDYTIYLYADPDFMTSNVPDPPTIALALGGAMAGFIRRLILARRG